MGANNSVFLVRQAWLFGNPNILGAVASYPPIDPSHLTSQLMQEVKISYAGKSFSTTSFQDVNDGPYFISVLSNYPWVAWGNGFDLEFNIVNLVNTFNGGWVVPAVPIQEYALCVYLLANGSNAFPVDLSYFNGVSSMGDFITAGANALGPTPGSAAFCLTSNVVFDFLAKAGQGPLPDYDPIDLEKIQAIIEENAQ